MAAPLEVCTREEQRAVIKVTFWLFLVPCSRIIFMNLNLNIWNLRPDLGHKETVALLRVQAYRTKKTSSFEVFTTLNIQVEVFRVVTPRSVVVGYQRLNSLGYSKSELTSEIMNPCTYFGRTPWAGDQLIARLRPTQKSTTQEIVYIHTHTHTHTHTHASSGILTYDPSVRAVKDHIHLRPRGYWDRWVHLFEVV
jgi:hypothetical protein